MENKKTQTIIGKEFADVVIPLIEEVKNSIDIIVYDWHWYPNQPGSRIQRFNNAILFQHQKNKKIRVLTNTKKTIKILQSQGVEAKSLHSSRLLHTKLMILDRKIAIIGSHNYSKNAFTLNYEISLLTFQEDVLKRLNRYFSNLW